MGKDALQPPLFGEEPEGKRQSLSLEEYRERVPPRGDLTPTRTFRKEAPHHGISQDRRDAEVEENLADNV